MLKNLEKPIFDIENITLKEINQGYIYIKDFSDKEYLYWDKIKYKLDINDPKEKVKIWANIKAYRRSKSLLSPIRSEKGQFFTYMETSYFKEFLYKIDFDKNIEFSNIFNKTDQKKKNQFVYHAITEEAIASAQIEGANTTRKMAKEFLRTGRKPKTYSEHMIINTYKTMQSIEKELKSEKMSLKLLFHLHEMITKNTMKSTKDIARFRKDDERIVVQDALTGDISHIPPNVAFVEKEIEKLIKFANNELDENFIHPIIKAIMLHFWIAHLHPFVDGNGRMARILFYWYLLRNGYSLFSFLPISTLIRKSANQYYMSYRYTEHDDYDLNYFIHYNLTKIEESFKEFAKYAENKSQETANINNILQTKFNLNESQIALLNYLHQNPNATTSIISYQNINQVSRKTGFNNLKDLEEKVFLSSKKIGRNVYYYATEKIKEIFD